MGRECVGLGGGGVGVYRTLQNHFFYTYSASLEDFHFVLYGGKRSFSPAPQMVSPLHPVRKHSLYCDCKGFLPSHRWDVALFRLHICTYFINHTHTHTYTQPLPCFCIYLLSPAVSKVQLNCKHRSENQQINDIGPRAPR